jgi:hypothetical protein
LVFGSAHPLKRPGKLANLSLRQKRDFSHLKKIMW